MISRIEAINYRCFGRLSVDLGAYHVLAGANGAGKTTFLDLVPLLGDLLTRRRASDAFLQRLDGAARPARATTLTELPHRGSGDVIAFAIEAELPESVTRELASSSYPAAGQPVPSHLRYELRLEISPRDLVVAEEYLYLFSSAGPAPEPGEIPQGRPDDAGRLRHAGWQPVISRDGRGTTRFTAETSALDTSEIPQVRMPPGTLALSALLPDVALFPAALWLYQLLSEGVAFFDPDWDLLRRPAPPGDPPQLLPSGRNAPWLALDLQRTDPDQHASWVDHVRTALPQVADIVALEREEDRYAYFRVRYAGGYEVTSSGLSDGTLRILALTLLPYLPAPVMPRLLVTEEPENGIHPRAIETVMQSLSSLYDSQVWVSTHSPLALAHTDLANVLISRFDGAGGVSVVPGNQHPRLAQWRGAVDLGTLFAAGVLS